MSTVKINTLEFDADRKEVPGYFPRDLKTIAMVQEALSVENLSIPIPTPSKNRT
jgi:hypothetical protein